MTQMLGALVAEAGLASAEVRGDAAVRVTGVVYDSRRVEAGSLFCCLRGTNSDGHAFAAGAVSAGASALLVDHELDLPVAQIVVPDTRAAMGPLSSAFHAHPSRTLTIVGVTGTNGKTTTTSLIAAVLEAADTPTGVIGTLTGKHTTPEAPDLQAQLAGFLAAGKRAVVMEVSSHALALHRVDGTRFALAVFTNLGRDHLDLHGTLEEYFAAKALLFEPSLSAQGIANADDQFGRTLVDTAPIPMTGFSRAELLDLEVTPTSHEYTWCGQRVHVGIGGAFNAMNSLAAATAAAALGVPLDVVAAGLSAAASVPGRFEPVRAGQAFDVIVDYAHTPDGLREALSAARAAVDGGRVIAVFGCGGDRDREKRPEMGQVAAELADQVVVTSDNPRSEDPLEIINAIIQGVPADYRHRVVSEPDRRAAFAAAFRAAQPGDVVVIAGKGHETTQTIGSDVIPFDDRAVARAILEAGE
ncbi:MAG: UDP-N-acetylmuramoyl-L-alanyl-D-glutamate--2,6-diaminopimelate ligase [Ilumatobacteraceae bacterium]